MDDKRIIDAIEQTQGLDQKIKAKALEIAMTLEGRESLGEKLVTIIAIKKAQQWFINLNG
ncbi:hypothetical protein [Pedobacter suwonensis]|uniref:hypothetical protein n=1 Tax=Pedobacter suwonensis TaxID=332999 RepID=UPI00368BA01D